MAGSGDRDAQAAGDRELGARLSKGLRRHLVDFGSLVSCERLSGGASQETYRVVVERSDGCRLELAMRRATAGSTSSEQVGLGIEALLFERARSAGVPEPRVVWVFAAEDELGEGFVMEWLEGETLGSRIVRSPELAEARPRLARQCGEILARIHGIELQASGLRRVLSEVAPRELVERTWVRYQTFGTPQPMIDYTARWLLEHLPAEGSRTLVHGDFRNGNLIVSPEGVIGVLDWELAHIGDPMRDLGWLCTNSWRFGNSALRVGGFGDDRDLFAGYQAVARQEVDPERVRFWEVFGSFWWSVGCLGMAQQYRDGPDRSVERAAIGRRSSECQVDCANLLIPGPVEPLAGAGARGTESAVASSSSDLPRSDELLEAVSAFLRHEVMDKTAGRTRFLARVAAGALDVARRELALGTEHRERQLRRLRAFFDSDSPLEPLQGRLVSALRDGMELDRPGLGELLREGAVGQLTIDQPSYSGLRTALEVSSPPPT